MGSLRLPLRLYVAGVILLGAMTGGLGILMLRPSADRLAVAIVLVCLATAAQLRPVHLTQKTKVTVEDAATFAAALLLDPGLAILPMSWRNAASRMRSICTWSRRIARARRSA